MVVVKILKRKDAASLVVAIATGLFVSQFVGDVTSHVSAFLSGVETSATFRADYWHPFVTFVMQLVALEIVARVAIVLHEVLVANRPR